MRGRRPAVGGDETELTGKPGDCDTADEAMEALSTTRTMAFIAQLPQDQAEAVVLRVVVGLDAKSAAGVLGKRAGAVRTSAHRGLKRLAELLGADEGGPSGGVEPGAVPPQRDPRHDPQGDQQRELQGDLRCEQQRGAAVRSGGVTEWRIRTQRDI
jgi:RNA polymerase sigma-70 factor (ECF subfamily)